MKLIYNEELVHDWHIGSLAELEEMALERDGKHELDGAHDVFGYLLALTIFVVQEIVSQIRAAQEKQRNEKTAALLAEIDTRVSSISGDSISDANKIALSLLQLSEEGKVAFEFDDASEADLVEGMRLLKKSLTEGDPEESGT